MHLAVSEWVPTYSGHRDRHKPPILIVVISYPVHYHWWWWLKQQTILFLSQ
jgi:hypothetical protein